MINSLIGLFAGFFILLAIILGILWILKIVACWRIFKKAGEPGWKALIPFYSTYIEYKIAWDPDWFWLWLVCDITLSFMPPSNVYLTVIISLTELLMLLVLVIQAYKMSLAFGHKWGYAIGLLFFPSLFELIIGFGKSQYTGPVELHIGKINI